MEKAENKENKIKEEITNEVVDKRSFFEKIWERDHPEEV